MWEQSDDDDEVMAITAHPWSRVSSINGEICTGSSKFVQLLLVRRHREERGADQQELQKMNLCFHSCPRYPSVYFTNSL